MVRAVEPDVVRMQALRDANCIPASANYANAPNDPAVEAVMFATPHSLHEAQIAAAASAGRFHVSHADLF